MKHMRFALAAATMGLAACGGGSSGGSSGGGGAAPTPTPTPTPTSTPAPQVTLSYLHIFYVDPEDGAQPISPLMQASDGNLYGMTLAGGENNSCDPTNPNEFRSCGTIYKVNSSGSVNVFHSFGETLAKGAQPSGRLMQGTDGALYGVTANGGVHGNGTAFKITLGGNHTVLHSFGATPNDGIVPQDGLVQGPDGNLYGVTASGGTNHCPSIPQAGGNCGTIFRLTPDGVKTTLHSFGGTATAGFQPNGPLLRASDGNFYGTTTNGGTNSCGLSGGTNNCGTVFRMTPSGSVTTLYSFGASPVDGIAPQGSLIVGRDGAMYGTTASGGDRNGGTVFRITTGGAYSIVFDFVALANGQGPRPHLVMGTDGNFYGMTSSGGEHGGSLNGIIFRLTPSGQLTRLYSFGPVNVGPHDTGSGLMQASDGAFYGVTRYNGTLGGVGARSGFGTLFKLAVN